MTVNAQFESALRSADRVCELRQVAQRLLKEGKDLDAVQKEFENKRKELRESGREEEEDAVMDVMDFLTGWCSPHMKLQAMPEMKWLLDTSALRAISCNNLEAIAKNHTLVVSPISFWEILCHLDETTKKRKTQQESFEFWKASLLKCGIPTLLDDPLVSLGSRACVPSLVNPTRFEDRQGIPLILAELQESTSLPDFHARTVTIPGSSPRLIGDIAKRTRECLAEDEQRYQQSIQVTATKILEGLGPDRTLSLHGSDFYIWALRAVAIGVYQDAIGTQESDADLFARLSEEAYVCGGYLFARTLAALEKTMFRTNEIVVDTNDMEDFMITMHLSWNKPCVLVTNDRGTLVAVRRALEELSKYKNSLEVKATVQTRAVTVEAFQAETQISNS